MSDNNSHGLSDAEFNALPYEQQLLVDPERVLHNIWLEERAQQQQDDDDLEIQNEKKIPESQYRKIKNDYDTIKAEFKTYINGYIKAVKKNRVEKEPLYRESCLVNFKLDL